MDAKRPFTIYNAVDKVVETIKTKVKSETNIAQIQEIQLLNEWCCSENPVIRVTACQGIVNLAQSSCLPIPETISALIISSHMSSSKNLSGITNAVVSLTLLKLEEDLSENDYYKCPYSSRSRPVHPFIGILNHRPHIWREVLNHMEAICNHSDKKISDNGLTLLRPVFQYVLQENYSLPESCRQGMWSLLVNCYTDSTFVLEVCTSFLIWDKIQELELHSYLNIFCEAVISKQNQNLMLVLPLILCVVIHRLIEAALNPQSALLLLKKTICSGISTHSTVLVMLSHSVTICPAAFLEHILDFCLWLLQQGNCTQDATWMCVSALLPWLVASPTQMHKSLSTASKIISLANKATANPLVLLPLLKHPLFPIVTSADSRITCAIHLVKLSEEKYQSSFIETEEWLKCTDETMFDQLHLYASSLLIGRSVKEAKLSALEFLTKCPVKYATHNLTIFLYQLAKEKEPDMQLGLLNALPSTIVDKDNIPIVLSTIETLRKSQTKVLRLLAVQLTLKLWRENERLYHLVVEDLSRNVKTLPVDEVVVVAAACKEICNLQPEKHGKELVVQISELLSRCVGPQGSVACAMALDALVPLCRESVIDAYSIWKHLAPRMCKDKRPAVLSSFCQLVSFTATASNTASDAPDVLAAVIKWLWLNVVSSPSAAVVKASLKALSNFKLDQLSLKTLPDSYKEHVKLPPELAKTPIEAARKPEDVMKYIPGDCWAYMLQQQRPDAGDAAVDMLSVWLRTELMSYHSGKYNIARGEPTDYKHLSNNSVCRGLFEFVRRTPSNALDNVMAAVKLCLAVGCLPLPKPLPPLNWVFMNDFLKKDDVELTSVIIKLLAKQAQISPSARNIVEAYISSSLSTEKVQFLYSILGDLCRGVPPNALRPFLEKTLHPTFEKNDINALKMMLGYIKSVIQKEKIHEANLVLLSQQIKTLWSAMDPQHELLDELLACTSELPMSHIESMCSLTLMWEITSPALQKAIKMRSYMAVVPDTSTPFGWLNEVIDAASSNPVEQILVIEKVNFVLSKLHSHPTAWNWLQELMGQIYKNIISNLPGLDFLVSLFILAVDWMSGYILLGVKTPDDVQLNLLRFPQAVKQLVKHHGDAKQMTEWLKFLQSQDTLNPSFVPVFYLAVKVVSLLE